MACVLPESRSDKQTVQEVGSRPSRTGRETESVAKSSMCESDGESGKSPRRKSVGSRRPRRGVGSRRKQGRGMTRQKKHARPRPRWAPARNKQHNGSRQNAAGAARSRRLHSLEGAPVLLQFIKGDMSLARTKRRRPTQACRSCERRRRRRCGRRFDARLRNGTAQEQDAANS